MGVSGSGSSVFVVVGCGSLASVASLLPAQMYRAPVRPQRSPGAPRPPSRFPSPSRDALGHRSPSAGLRFGGSGPHGGSPRGCPPFSPGSPCYSPGPVRGYRSCSPGGFRDSPPGFGGGGGRGFGGHTRRRGDEFRRPQPFSPTSGPRAQAGSSDSVEKYFSPSMLQDPWNDLTPMSAEAVKRKHS